MSSPLWLPRGSVRAIIALAFVGTTLALIGVSVLRADGNIPAALAALIGLVGPIVKDYFGDRQATEPPPDGTRTATATTATGTTEEDDS